MKLKSMTARMNLIFAAMLFAGLIVTGCSQGQKFEKENAMSIQVSSAAFAADHSIPRKYTCQGDDVSPPLNWSGAPAQTKSFALICEDPDAPMGAFTHWVIFNLPANANSLPENVAKTDALPDGSLQGKNSFKKTGYSGPCPPPGKPHRYFFKLYALDAPLNLESGASKKELLDAMNGHVLAEGELMGTYQRK